MAQTSFYEVEQLRNDGLLSPENEKNLNPFISSPVTAGSTISLCLHSINSADNIVVLLDGQMSLQKKSHSLAF